MHDQQYEVEVGVMQRGIISGTRKVLLQDVKADHLLNVKPAPVWKVPWRTTVPTNLEGEHLMLAVLDAVDVRFDNSLQPIIGELNEEFIEDRFLEQGIHEITQLGV